ncbi:MAG: CidA/LrgA family protein [Methylovirgula sp.]|nr:CidA/LrgA family protein [Methylovirgula sp.]
MLVAVFTLLGVELSGELLRSALHLPVPGPVVGMILLAGWLIFRGYGCETAPAAPGALDETAGVILNYLGLLFVPAGVGIIAEFGLIRQQWLPILGGVIGSTVLSLAVTGLVLHHLIRRKAAPKKARILAVGDKPCIAKS